MSEYPFQDPGQFNANPGYMPAGSTAGSGRPGAVSGLAITGIVLGSLGVLCNGFGMVSGAIMLGNGGKNPFAGAAMPASSPTFVHLSMIGAVVGLLFWIALIAGCAMALKLRPMARSGMISWSFAMILWQSAWLFMQIAFLMPEQVEMMKKMQANQPPNPASGQIAGMMNGILIGTYIFYWLLFCILPVLFLSMWTRPRIKAAFERGPIPK